jgi:hypothetical protein
MSLYTNFNLEEDNLWRTATVVVSIGEDEKLNGLKEMIEYERHMCCLK